MTRHQIIRHRHETKRRTLTVAAIEALTPRMIRIHFTSDDMADFVSASYDDHIKMLMAPVPGAPMGEKPPMRDFTPRRFDTNAGTIAIDYAVHDGGPAIEWAKAAKVGDILTIGGPRGSAVIPDDFDWYMLIGDESALPAMGRRVEELRAGVPVTTIAIVASDAEAQSWETRAVCTPQWLVRSEETDDTAQITAALSGNPLPSGEGFIWIAAEASVARAVRRFVVEELGHPAEWLKAAGYWQRGEADSHVRIED